MFGKYSMLLTMLLTIILLTGKLCSAQSPINIPLTDWRGSEGTQISIVKDASGEQSLKIIFIFLKNTKWPEVRVKNSKDLSNYNCLSFKLKASRAFQEGALILYSPGMRAIMRIPQAVHKRELPGGEWLDIKWYFHNDKGWITGKTNTFDYTQTQSLGIVFGSSSIKKHGALTIEIKDVKISCLAEGADSQKAALKEFSLNYRPSGLAGKKIILWPSTVGKPGNRITAEHVSENIEIFKTFPVDGLSMDLLPAPFRDEIFSPHPISEKKIQEVVALCKSTDWGHLKNNFIRIDIVTNILDSKGKRVRKDWFDDRMWEHIIKKIKTVARACKDIQFNILFDNEAYSEEPYDYFNIYRNTGKSFAEYQEQVKKRGTQVVEAIAEEYPGARILTLWSNWAIGVSPDQARYGLLPAFIDGMLSAKGDAEIIDGYEQGYDCRVPADYVEGRFRIMKLDPALSSIPEIYRDKLKIGFAAWLRPDKFTIPEFVECIRGALENTDKYVWIYNQDSDYRDKKTQSYINALKEIER